MCGRYTQTADLQALQERFRFVAREVELKPRYNIAPTQEAPVVVQEDERALALLRWGLIPSWAKDSTVGSRLINARAETLLEKPSFKKPFQRSRCLVLADGFYEWKKGPGGKGKIPMRVVLKSRGPFAMAGLWDAWKSPDGALVKSFSIITTAADEAMKVIHDRMPAILRPQDEDLWLDPQAGPEKLFGLLKPWPGELEAYETSPLVNSPVNDSPACSQPLLSERGGADRMA